jgi:hypothetical protein
MDGMNSALGQSPRAFIAHYTNMCLMLHSSDPVMKTRFDAHGHPLTLIDFENDCTRIVGKGSRSTNERLTHLIKLNVLHFKLVYGHSLPAEFLGQRLSEYKDNVNTAHAHNELSTALLMKIKENIACIDQLSAFPHRYLYYSCTCREDVKFDAETCRETHANVDCLQGKYMRLQTTAVCRMYNVMCDEKGALYIKHDGTISDFNELRSQRLGYDSPYIAATSAGYVDYVQGQTVCAACVNANGVSHKAECEAKSFLCRTLKPSE